MFYFLFLYSVKVLFIAKTVDINSLIMPFSYASYFYNDWLQDLLKSVLNKNIKYI